MLEDNVKKNEETGKEVDKIVGESSKEKDVKNVDTLKVSPSLTKRVNIMPRSKEVSTIPVVLSKEELETLDYTDFSTPARMLKLGEVLVKSSLVPLKKAEDVVTALMTGRELGLPFITSLSQIYPINGRPTLGVHIQKAILLKNGIVFSKTEDAVAIYEYAKVINKKTIILLEGILDEQPKESKKKLIGFRTTYHFSRELKRPSGKFIEVEAYGSFSTMEASTAELLDKDVWKKYYKRMLDARAFTNGAREIADDLLLGISTPNELSNDYYINDRDEEVRIAHIIEQD